MADKVLLAENEIDLLDSYKMDLMKSGFEVVDVWDGDFLLRELKKYGSNYFDVIVSDTDMIDLDGPDAVRIALEDKLLNPERTLIVGMSDVEDNQYYWRGIANLGCFYNKFRISDNRLGTVVNQSLRNFRSGGLWKEKMPA